MNGKPHRRKVLPQKEALSAVRGTVAPTKHSVDCLPSQAWPGLIISSRTCGRYFVLLLRYVFMCFCLHWTVSRPRSPRSAAARLCAPHGKLCATRLRASQQWRPDCEARRSGAVTVRVQARAAHQANNTVSVNFTAAKLP